MDRPGYDEVRLRLKERGYLDSRIERFVLLSSVTSGVPLRGVVGTAAKAAVVVGPLLAGLIAAILAWSERPLESWADPPLLWIYLLAPSTLAVFALDLLTALAAGALAGSRRPRPVDPGRAAAVAGLAALAYVLAVWWMRSGERRVVEDLLFVLVAVPVVAAIGRLAGLVSIAGILRRSGTVPELRRRRRGTVVLLALVAAGLAFVARGWLGPGTRPAGLVPFVPQVQTSSVVVIGIDGLDGSLVAALDARGALPNLLGALERGATFPLRRTDDAEPAEVWTTIATGLPPDDHGIGGARADTLPGVRTTLRGALPLWTAWRLLLPTRVVPASGIVRRAPALWEIGSEHAGTAVVGWWATWPSPLEDPSHEQRLTHYVVSDRVLPRLQDGSPADRDTYPASLGDRLRANFDDEVDGLRRDFASRFAGIAPRFETWAWDSYLIDTFVCSRLVELLADERVEAGFAYLPGLDILRHRLAEPSPASSAPEMFDVLKVLELYATAIDTRLEPLLTSGRFHTVVIADRGRSGAAEGFVSVRGAMALPSCVGPPIGVLDVAPIVLRLMGFPASDEMQGRVPSACLVSPAQALGRVETFGRLPRGERGAALSADDPEILDRLRSLGYLR